MPDATAVRELRDYQAEDVDAILRSWQDGQLRTGYVLPMGCGKSTVVGEVIGQAVDAGGRGVILAHRGELLDQLGATARKLRPHLKVGRYQAERSELGRPVLTVSVDTLAARLRKLDRLVEQGAPAREIRRLEQRLVPRLGPNDRIAVDEAHHAVSPSYMRVLRHLGAFDNVPTLGVTATMIRGDTRGLGDVWQGLAAERSFLWAIEQGILVRPHGRVVVVDALDTSRVRKGADGDYAPGQLGVMVAQGAGQMVDAWCEHAHVNGRDRITAAFLPTVDAARQLEHAFTEHRCARHPNGVVAETVTGATPVAERGDAERGTGIYGRLARGITRVLCSVMVTTEGWDCPPVSCILWARPTLHVGLYQQGIGRGLRKVLEELARRLGWEMPPVDSDGQQDCLVLDVVGATPNQTLATLVELDPTATIDRSALEDLPCADCGKLTRAALLRLYEANAMSDVPEPDEYCTCRSGERDPDGGRIRLDRPPTYADHDYFAASEYRWLFTHDGIRFLAAGRERCAVLWPANDPDPGEEPLYWAGHCAQRRRLDGVWLTDAVPLEEARAAAERWAESHAAGAAKRGRDLGGRPNVMLVRAAEARGVRVHGLTRKQLEDAVAIADASRRLDHR